MNNQEKERQLMIARYRFEIFYKKNKNFLEDRDFKPGKKTYRNMTSINKMMECFVNTGSDYIVKEDVKETRRWDGPSSYVQHERIITNFDLSAIDWRDQDRSVLVLNNNGIKLRKQYEEFLQENPDISLAEMTELPTFAIDYLRTVLEKTKSGTMTLWKNTIFSALYLYSILGYIPYYSQNRDNIPEN